MFDHVSVQDGIDVFLAVDEMWDQFYYITRRVAKVEYEWTFGELTSHCQTS